jgi:hypothetical protein
VQSRQREEAIDIVCSIRFRSSADLLSSVSKFTLYARESQICADCGAVHGQDASDNTFPIRCMLGIFRGLQEDAPSATGMRTRHARASSARMWRWKTSANAVFLERKRRTPSLDPYAENALGSVLKLALEYSFFLRVFFRPQRSGVGGVCCSPGTVSFGREADFSTAPLTVKL